MLSLFSDGYLAKLNNLLTGSTSRNQNRKHLCPNFHVLKLPCKILVFGYLSNLFADFSYKQQHLAFYSLYRLVRPALYLDPKVCFDPRFLKSSPFFVSYTSRYAQDYCISQTVPSVVGSQNYHSHFMFRLHAGANVLHSPSRICITV